jgi:hypothetical protein
MPPPTAARELLVDAAPGRGDDYIVPDLAHDTRQMSAFLRKCLTQFPGTFPRPTPMLLLRHPVRLWRPETFTWITAEERSLRRLLQSCSTLPI